jgi:hypothetical protein
MIPKIIHYCWFGGNPLPELAQRCIAGWRKYFPDYEIKEWNESNYDIHKTVYTDEAYNAKKYAFVSDYARFDVLYNYGGIYFDTDVEVIRSFDDILKNGAFMGFESAGKVAVGLGIGCSAGLGILSQMLDYYSTIRFLNSDGTYNLHTVVEYFTGILKQSGLKSEDVIQTVSDITVYPTDYFAPKSNITGKLHITQNTHSIHHYEASWLSKKEQAYYKRKRTFSRLLGRRLGIFVSIPFFVIMNINCYGFIPGVKRIFAKLLNK